MHERVADILRELDGPIDDEVLGLLRAAFSSGGVKGATKEKLASALERLAKGSEPTEWIPPDQGPKGAGCRRFNWLTN